MAIYNAFRILISEQPGLFPADRDKKDIFKEILTHLVDVRREEYIYKGTKHIWFFLSNMAGNIFIYQFAKEERYNTPKEVEGKIQIVVDIRLPYVDVIIDWERQIFLIENKPSVFPTMDILISRLEGYFERQIIARTHAQYKVTLSDISKEVDFWNEVGDADRIYSLELSFNPPNLFEGRFEANELVKEAYEATDFSQFKLKFINNKGHLKLLQDNLKNFISLIASGGGNYLLKMVKFRGKKKESRKINSRYFASQQTLPDDISELTEKDLNARLEKIDKQNETPKSLLESKEVKMIGLFGPPEETNTPILNPSISPEEKPNNPKSISEIDDDLI